MSTSVRELRIIQRLSGRLHGTVPERVRSARQALRGGLEAADVERLTARHPEEDGRERVLTVVAQRPVGATMPEAASYERSVFAHAAGLSPELLAVDRVGPKEAVLDLGIRTRSARGRGGSGRPRRARWTARRGSTPASQGTTRWRRSARGTTRRSCGTPQR